MNIALPPIILLILILPGLLLRYTYRKGTWKSPIIFDTVLNELAAGIVVSIVIHLFCYLFLVAIGIFYDFNASLAILTGFYSQDGFKYSVEIVGRQFAAILSYLAAINIISAAVGLLLHMVVRFLNLDLKMPALRFGNEWYYAFSGEMQVIDALAELPIRERLWVKRKNIRDVLDTLYVYVSAVTTQGSRSYLYWGILSDYYFGKDGKLDRIVIIKARRRDFVEDISKPAKAKVELEDERFYEIYGDYLVIDYSKINTLNLDYRFIEEQKQPNKSLKPTP
jgi:hypothetical protein